MVEPATTLTRLSPVASAEAVSFMLQPPMTRLAARGGTEALIRLSHALGLDPPGDFLRAHTGGGKSILSLGPDEFLMLAEDVDHGLAKRVEGGLDGEPGCIVDVSHRQVGIVVAGPFAAVTLNAGCPLDLDLEAFPIAMCTRTILGKADIVLWRQSEDRFWIECWRSFTPYVMAFLKQAANDVGS